MTGKVSKQSFFLNSSVRKRATRRSLRLLCIVPQQGVRQQDDDADRDKGIGDIEPTLVAYSKGGK